MLDLSKLTIYADRIFVFEEALDNPDYAIHMHKTMDDMLMDSQGEAFHKLVPWQTSDGTPHVYGTKRISSREHLENTKNEEVKAFFSKVDALFDEAGRYYFEQLGMDYQDGKLMTDYAIFHYYTGQEMGPHVDDDYQPQVDPICTGIIYLNNDRVGGDLWFPEQDVLLQVKPGTLVIFPCVKPFYHASTKIVEGEKWHIGTGWKRHRTIEEIDALGPNYGVGEREGYVPKNEQPRY
jgi:hypothetical protein